MKARLDDASGAADPKARSGIKHATRRVERIDIRPSFGCPVRTPIYPGETPKDSRARAFDVKSTPHAERFRTACTEGECPGTQRTLVYTPSCIASRAGAFGNSGMDPAGNLGFRARQLSIRMLSSRTK
jgi:hypothetical protein